MQPAPREKRFYLCGYHTHESDIGLGRLCEGYDTFEEAMAEAKRRQPSGESTDKEWLSMWAIIDDEDGKWQVITTHEQHPWGGS